MKEVSLLTTCPHCGAALDAVSNPTSDRAPKPGNVTICVACLEPSQFDVEMRMQKVDWNNLPADFRERLKQVVREARAQRHAKRLRS